MIINKVIRFAKTMGMDIEELMQMPLIDVIVAVDEHKESWNKWEKELATNNEH